MCVVFTFLYELTFYIRGLRNDGNAKIYFEIADVIPFIICVFLLLLGAFLGFTATYSRIDFVKKRIKYVTKVFGIIPIGKWTYLTSDMKLGVKKTKENWRALSRGNRSILFDVTEIIIVLYDKENREIIPVKKVKKAKFAKTELEKLCELLECQIYV